MALGDALLVERPQVFEAAAAPADDHHVRGRPAAEPIEQANGRGDLLGGAVALDAHRADPDFGRGQRRPRISSMSRTAAPVGLVTRATRRGKRGSGFLRFGSK